MRVHDLAIPVFGFVREHGPTPLREAFERYVAERLALDAATAAADEIRARRRRARQAGEAVDDADERAPFDLDSFWPGDVRNIATCPNDMSDDEALARLAAVHDRCLSPERRAVEAILPADALEGAGLVAYFLRGDAGRLDEFPRDVERLAGVLERVGKWFADEREAAKAADAGKVKTRRRAGRKPTTDPQADNKLYADWEASRQSVREFASQRRLPERDIQKAIDRVRSRRNRAKSAGR